jgi:hypothetical protein
MQQSYSKRPEKVSEERKHLRLSSNSLCFHGRSDEGIGLSSLEQVNDGSVDQLQTPLCSLKLRFLSAFHPLFQQSVSKLTIPILVFL